MVFKKNNNNFWHILITILLIILISLVSFFIYIYYKKTITKNDNIIIIKEEKKDILTTNNTNTNINNDIPIYPKTLPTYNNTTYQQIGILTSDENDPLILPLFSRKINNRSDRWNYYTATDKNNMMRLPIRFNNMNCEDDIGCREIYNNDTLTIEIYKGRTFTATIYKVDAPRYFADKY